MIMGSCSHSNNPSFQIANQVNPTRRVVEQVEVNFEFIQKILKELNLTAFGEIHVPEEGRIASNVCVQTLEKGRVMLRFYPAGCQDRKLESGNVDFEVEALHYLSSANINVPKPLIFPNNKPIQNENGIKIFAYQILSGKTLKAGELSVEIARKAGQFLKEMIKESELYHPSSTCLPDGDLEYIGKIHKTQQERLPAIKTSAELKEMDQLISDPLLLNEFHKTPKGLVHADFFFENIIVDENGKLGTIDFGDTYYGHVIQDIVIGSMEFCVKEDRSWDVEMFKAFIEPHAEWLKKNQVSFDLFYKLLQANCLRFAIYTLPGTVEEGEPLETNPYIFRFNKLKESELKTALEQVYHALVK